MAAVLGFVKATPYSLVLEIAGGDGGELVFPYAGADGIGTKVVAGPLQQQLSKLAATSPATLDSLNLDQANSGKVRARFVTGAAGSRPTPGSLNIHWTSTGLSLTVAASAIIIIELRFQHSVDR